jgi:hypothetical protein
MMSPTRIVKTGKRAEQLMNGVTKMVMSLSFQWSMVRVAMIAGIAQAQPDISGTTLFPLSPTLLISLSMRNTTRAM